MEVNLWFPPVKSCSYTSYKYENCNFTDICASIDMTTNEQFYFTSMDNENISTILDEVKGAFGLLNESTANELRGLSNKYECLGKGPRFKGVIANCIVDIRCFVNRSALKLANLDQEFNLLRRTDQKDGKPFSMLDLCGGPGGFIEYCVLKFRTQNLRLRGFGMSLVIGESTRDKGMSHQQCNWNLNHLNDRPRSAIVYSESCSSLDHQFHEGPRDDGQCKVHLLNGPLNNGDIYERDNVDSIVAALRQYNNDTTISASTDDSRTLGSSDTTDSNYFVDFVCADGGFDTSDNIFSPSQSQSLSQVQSQSQEIASVRLLWCQVAAMVRALSHGGRFLLKMFSCREPASCEIFLFLTRIFDEVTITKPVTSRPGSAERYLICQGLRPMSCEERCHIADIVWETKCRAHTAGHGCTGKNSQPHGNHLEVVPDEQTANVTSTVGVSFSPAHSTEAIVEEGDDVGITLGERGDDVGITLGERGADVGITLGERGADVGITIGERGADVGITLGERGADRSVKKDMIEWLTPSIETPSVLTCDKHTVRDATTTHSYQRDINGEENQVGGIFGSSSGGGGSKLSLGLSGRLQLAQAGSDEGALLTNCSTETQEALQYLHSTNSHLMFLQLCALYEILQRARDERGENVDESLLLRVEAVLWPPAYGDAISPGMEEEYEHWAEAADTHAETDKTRVDCVPDLLAAHAEQRSAADGETSPHCADSIVPNGTAWTTGPPTTLGTAWTAGPPTTLVHERVYQNAVERFSTDLTMSSDDILPEADYGEVAYNAQTSDSTAQTSDTMAQSSDTAAYSSDTFAVDFPHRSSKRRKASQKKRENKKRMKMLRLLSVEQEQQRITSYSCSHHSPVPCSYSSFLIEQRRNIVDNYFNSAPVKASRVFRSWQLFELMEEAKSLYG